MEDRDRERGEGERGKEICVLILLKKGWYIFNDWRKERKKEKNKIKYNNNNKIFFFKKRLNEKM